jgi:hypothetical protein
MNGKLVVGSLMVVTACARRPLPAVARVDFVRENYAALGLPWTFETLSDIAPLELPSRLDEGSKLVSSSCTGTPVEVEIRSDFVLFHKSNETPVVDADCELVAENGTVMRVILKTRDATVREQEHMERHIRVSITGGPCPEVLGDRCSVHNPIPGVEGMGRDGKVFTPPVEK